MKIGKSIGIALICIILGVMISWQYKSINYNLKANTFQNKRTEELKDELIRLQNTNSDLLKRLEELQAENKEYENAKAGDEVVMKNLETARIFGGLVDVTGKGVIITLDNTDYMSVEGEDILSVVNELRASDAQAISVNGERIVAMSEIRSAPPYIMINGRQLTAPFIIYAIGDPEKIEHSLKMINGVIEHLQNFQINVDLVQSDNISIPAVRDDGSIIKTDLLTPVKQ
jgi:uncharacterized protein YlxW (UPF0749 family)